MTALLDNIAAWRRLARHPDAPRDYMLGIATVLVGWVNIIALVALMGGQ